MRRLPLLIGGLAATLATGCLSTPELKGCAEYPRDTPECAEYWANRADEGAEAGPADVGPDTGRPDDAAVDEGQPADARPDAAWPADGGPIDGPLPDDATPDDAAIDAAPTDGWVDGPPDMAQGECQPGDTIACGTDVGACESGVLRCDQNGHWSED
ncbi:MAG: hypothetical protein KC620_13345, partial [Myxococcales bacterium]|nr:hypothetical protein [Myxococcales bacterium]